MIYCVTFDDVAAHLHQLGFREVGRVEHQVIYRGADDELLILREPNLEGHIPENLANDAFYTAGLRPPDWAVFWCD